MEKVYYAAYYEVTVDETGRGSLNEDPTRFNQIKERCESVGAVNGFLMYRYGHMPRGRHKVYADGPNGEVIEVGFVHSYWVKNYDKSYLHTDWIRVKQIKSEVVLIRDMNKEMRKGE